MNHEMLYLVFGLSYAVVLIGGIFIGFELPTSTNSLAESNQERILNLEAGISSHALNSGMHSSSAEAGGFRP